jgi:hypothetical protein
LNTFLPRLVRVFCAAALAGLCMHPSSAPAEPPQTAQADSFHQLFVGDQKLRLPTTIEFDIHRKDRDAPLGRKVFGGEQAIADPVPLDSIAIDLDQVLPEVGYGGLIFIATHTNALFADTYCKYLAMVRQDKNLEHATEGEVVRIPGGPLGEMYVLGKTEFVRRPVVLVSSASHFVDMHGTDFGPQYTWLAAVRPDVLISLKFYSKNLPQKDWELKFALLDEQLSSWLIEPLTTFEASTGDSRLACSS